jgi:hypothetical protein
LQNGLFAQHRRYAQNFILGILTICLRQNFSHASILNENPHFAKGSSVSYSGTILKLLVVPFAPHLPSFSAQP